MPLPDLQSIAQQLEQGNAARAVPELEALAARFPAYVTPHVLLARAYERLGDPPRALEACGRVFSLMPGNPAAQEILGRLTGTPVASAPEPVPALVEPAAAADVPIEAAERFERPAESESAEGLPGLSPEHVTETIEALEPEPAPAAPPEPAPEPDPTIRDLDALIRQLEGARIQPQPGLAASETAEVEEEEGEEVVSETLARIYAAQREFEAAARTYERLAAQQPDRADEFRQKASEMRQQTG